MTTRTFKQRGLGYGSEPVNIVAKINGTVAYEGPVTTVDSLPPATAEPVEHCAPLFAWSGAVDFDGEVEVEVTVTSGGMLVIAETVANYSRVVSKINDEQSAISSCGSDEYIPYFSEVKNSRVYSDPYTSPKIDEIPVDRNRSIIMDDYLSGQWYYYVPNGSTFTGTLKIQPGIE